VGTGPGIAYANEHWATGRPGWKFDRGRMYIMNGPPDEIDSHNENKPYPFEEWKYRYLEGFGVNVTLKFIDWTGDGDYRLGGPAKRNPTSP